MRTAKGSLGLFAFFGFAAPRNKSNCRWQGHSNLNVGGNDVILDSLLGDLEGSGVLSEPFAELVRDDSLDICFSYVLGCLDGLWYEFAMEHFESKRAASFDVALLVCYDVRLSQSVCGFNRHQHSCR